MIKNEQADRNGADSVRPGQPLKPSRPEPKEIGGPKGPEPTRYGDWQYKGRVTDF